MKRRVFLIVLDSLGVGGAVDAAEFGDEGAATLQNTAAAVGGLRLPNLDGLGLRRLAAYESPLDPPSVRGGWGVMAPASADKDSTTGHWELMGLVSPEPFPTFPEGFPEELMSAFSERTGYGWLCNRPASGTEVLERLGAEHLATGRLIVYTSADSVFQIAAHEELVPVEELYRVCRLTRELLDPWRISRVIARPFIGSAESGFTRTGNRRDFSVEPTGPTVLDALKESGTRTVGVGKIGDLFAGRGLVEDHHTSSNAEGMELTSRLAAGIDGPALLFTNLVDFDTRYGHRRDPAGYAAALDEFDGWLGGFLPRLDDDDLLIITADHGCDPTHHGTDHTRERVPLLCLHGGLSGEAPLGIRESFCDVGTSVAAFLGLRWPVGESFLGGLGLEDPVR